MTDIPKDRTITIDGAIYPRDPERDYEATFDGDHEDINRDNSPEEWAREEFFNTPIKDIHLLKAKAIELLWLAESFKL